MAIQYRDYGAIGYDTAPEVPVNTVVRRQVYQATHGGDDKRLPFMNRSFISFSFGSKLGTDGLEHPVNIEDFDLIASISGNSLNRKGYAAFDDNTTTYDNLPGQQYWSTHYRANTIDFILVTDGIDQQKLDDFLYWFRAGDTKELILAEHPNRAILARVAQPPELNLLPFEQKVEITISDYKYTTSTTLYKGEIQLSLVMDEPHWYALRNILGEKITRGQRTYYEDYWRDINTNQLVSIFASKDALKILYEDGIPLGSMIKDNMLLGNGAYANVGNETESLIWSISEEDENFIPFDDPEFPGEGVGARIVANDATSDFTAVIAGAMVDISGEGISSLGQGVEAYFFYAGTAPAPTIISFTLNPKIDSSSYYITVPKNSITSEVPYNTITIKSQHEQQLRFTTPNIFTSYNKVIQIFNNMINSQRGYTWEQIREKIREDIRHPIVRAWANNVISSISNNDSVVATGNINTICSSMSNLFRKSDSSICPVKFTFNSETGEATGEFEYRQTFGSTTLVSVTEDVGDMLKSNYIIIQDRNYTTSDGKVLKWENEPGKQNRSHMFKHDCETNLQKISILYKNMYL